MHVQLCSLHLNQFHLCSLLDFFQALIPIGISGLKELEMIKVDRCYKPSTFESVDLCQLYCFAHASDISYGCVFYLRLIEKEGKISLLHKLCKILFAIKTKGDAIPSGS
jgi:hypothetical protein